MSNQPTTPSVPTNNANASTAPANEQQAQRGRGRGGRPGRGRGYNQRNKEKAQSEINPNGPKVIFDNEFLGSRTLQRGNIRVSYDHGFTERVAAVYHDNISAIQSSQNFFDTEGKPYDLDYLTRGLAGGLCIANAVKLVQATPASDLPAVGQFKGFDKYVVRIPKSYVAILDTIGKTDINDGNLVLRVKDNETIIQRFLLKAIKFFKQNQDFADNYIFLDEAKRAKLDLLNDISLPDFGDIYFTDKPSAEEIRSRARAVLDQKLRTNFQIKINDVDVTFGYPQLPDDITAESIVHWLSQFVDGVHPDFNAIIRTGVLLLVDMRWLANAQTAIKNIDRRFDGTAIADLTPSACLNMSGLHHISEFLEIGDFISLARSCYSYYDSVITIRLIPLLAMTEQGHSIFGNSGQLAQIPEDSLYLADDRGLPRLEINQALNHSLSFIKHVLGDQALAASFVRLTREVEFDPDYQNHFATPFHHSRFTYFSRDGVMNTKERMIK